MQGRPVTTALLWASLGWLLLASGGVQGRDGRKSYNGDKLVRVKLSSQMDVDSLAALRDREGIEFWTALTNKSDTVDIHLSAEVADDVLDYSRQQGLHYDVAIDNLQAAIDSENPFLPSAEESEWLVGRQGHSMTWNAYHRVAVIHGYLDYLATTYPTRCSVVTVATSYEGRLLKALRIGSGSKAIWIDGGIHAREWISPATVTYFIKELVENYDRHPELVDEITWYILPVANPDGYEYSHNGERLWRKTRSLGHSYRCQGVDPNRNWDFHWNEVGASSRPCSIVYAGPRPFSEPETAGMSNFIRNNRRKIKAYISVHSYSQMLLVPYGYSDTKPRDYSDLMRVASAATRALRDAGGPFYRVGTAPDLMYKASGGSDDWAKGSAGIKYSYTFELRDTGRYGFLLPASYIEQSGKETFAGIQVIARAVLAL